VIFAATAIAFSAHDRALLIKAGREGGGWPGTGGGSCWANDMDKLFTNKINMVSNFFSFSESMSYLTRWYGNLRQVTSSKPGGIEARQDNVDLSPHNGAPMLEMC